jgi:hypothetical protein
MTETLKKKIVAILVWVLIILPVHIAMGSVSVIDRDDPSMQSIESSMSHQLSGAHNNNDQDKDNSSGHCKQDSGCNGCDACSHCINAICSVTLFSEQTSHILFSSPSITFSQTDKSATFRPPKRS